MQIRADVLLLLSRERIIENSCRMQFYSSTHDRDNATLIVFIRETIIDNLKNFIQ